MAIKQNAEDFSSEYPLAARAVRESFYVDDSLMGVDSLDMATELQHQVQEVFQRGGFVLHKWLSNEPVTVKPPSRGHFGTVAIVLCLEVVHFSEVALYNPH